ncbi:MAG: flagellar basal body-associated FliL family protein [Oligoflexia bacterium]|nr:flagellar basal body-associated FliL family protein [Oligoflexia bacterium]
MAEENKEEKKEEPKKEGPTLAERLPQILMNAFIGLNCFIMLGGTIMIYKIKILDKRVPITEENQKAALNEDRLIREEANVRFTFDRFIVNLDEKPRKLVNTTIELEMLNEDGYVEVVEKTPVARDEIVKIINSKKYRDIESIQGKLLLKDQIMTAMNQLLLKGTVRDVYFSEFVVQ